MTSDRSTHSVLMGYILWIFGFTDRTGFISANPSPGPSIFSPWASWESAG
jgi:hypothetical protein